MVTAGPTDEDWFRIASDEFGLYQLEREILAFLAYARERAPRYGCEVGTWKSGTTFLLAQLLPSLELLVGVDRELQNEAKLRVAAPPGRRLVLVEGLSTAAETTQRIERILGGAELDLLFIDGGHSYDAASADFLAYRSFVREGGLIAFHDIVPDYRSRFGIKTGPWGGEVPRLWEEVKRSWPSVEFVDDPDQNGYGIGVIEYTRPTRLSASG